MKYEVRDTTFIRQSVAKLPHFDLLRRILHSSKPSYKKVPRLSFWGAALRRKNPDEILEVFDILVQCGIQICSHCGNFVQDMILRKGFHPTVSNEMIEWVRRNAIGTEVVYGRRQSSLEVTGLTE